MRMVQQQFTVPPAVDVISEIDREWNRIKTRLNLTPGLRIAVGVGSRGIGNLAAIVRAMVLKLKEAGCTPFITPAMGSHGGASADGQVKILTHLGIAEENVGAPVQATMAVQSMGEVDGMALFLDRIAFEADGIVVINRIKPHTDFSGPTESGLIKMMAIGLGNQVGADYYHRMAVVRDMYEIFNRAGTALIKRTNFLIGVGLVENQKHETTILKMATAEDVLEMEAQLLKKAKACFARLPLEKIDLLIIDEIGKDISGAGMDPNVTGRITGTLGKGLSNPKISRIFVRDLTEASEGNAIGIGEADFTTQRLVDKIDFQTTAINSITACTPESGRIPLTYTTDKEAIDAALMTIRPCTQDDLRIVHIKNTLDLNFFLASEGCVPDLKGIPQVHIEPNDIRLQFDSSDNLKSCLK